MMLKTVDLLFVGFIFTGIMIKPSKCQPNRTIQPNEPRCLTYLDEVVQMLSSKIPPIKDSRMTDNYYNISRALYPSIDLPALYVRVTIQFLKDYQNGTKIIDDHTMKLTWSTSCTYVSVKHISLFAMTVFSLATISPQRRETELTITVLPLCNDSPYKPDDEARTKMWRYIVSTLEDIAVNSKTSDPRINTVACVVEGHECDKDQPIKYPKESGLKVIRWYFCWLVLIASFVTSLVVWFYLCNWLKDAMKHGHEEDRSPEPEDAMSPNPQVVRSPGHEGHEQAKDRLQLQRILAGTILKMTIITFAITSLICPLAFIIHIEFKIYVIPYVITYSILILLFLISLVIISCCYCNFDFKGTILIKVAIIIAIIGSIPPLLAFVIRIACKIYVIIYVIAYSTLISLIPFLAILRCCYDFICRHVKPNAGITNFNDWCYELGRWLLFPVLIITTHHLLWVLCGIISEPYWATPIFLMECLFGFSIMYSLYLYEKDVLAPKPPIITEGKNWIIAHLVMAVVAFALILLVVVFVGHGHIVNVTDAGVIQVIITVTLMWLIKNSGLHLKSFKKSTDQRDGTEMQPLNTA